MVAVVANALAPKPVSSGCVGARRGWRAAWPAGDRRPRGESRKRARSSGQRVRKRRQPHGGLAGEILLARHDAGARRAPMRELIALAEARHAPLVLMPHIDAAAGARPAAGARLLLGGFDALLGVQVAVNLLVVGASVGAYGQRMLAALLPHGPLELAAFALALTVYARARQGALTVPRAATLGAAALLALALAALLESYVTI